MGRPIVPKNSKSPQPTNWRLLFAVSIGNALEWFDFVIYGYFADVISRNFFSTTNRTVSLLVTFGIFGAAFILRPVGAVILGNYADRHGRKPALTLAITLMTFGTGIIALTPPAASIGLIASALIVTARICQGFSAGGEFGSATALLSERDAKSRGFYTSWQFASQALAAMLATGAGAALSNALTDVQLDRWGWRIPFIFGMIIGPVGYYIRKRIDESPEFQPAQRTPLREILAAHKGPLLTTVGMVVVLTVVSYTLLFIPTFVVRQLGLPIRIAFEVGLITSAGQLLLIPLIGALSDRWQRLPIAMLCAAGILLFSYPLLATLISTPTLTNLLIFQFCITVLAAGYAGVLPALMAGLFPASVRSTGLSISYALAVAIFGGFAPFINTSLIELTGSKLVPAYYLMFAAALTLVALDRARKRRLHPHLPASRSRGF
jgi:MHS family proline/betaine transporter-like MFS transporter